MEKQFDIFISYRRVGGKEVARNVQLALQNNTDWKVFLDFDDLDEGKFDPKIRAAIEEAPTFIVVLSPGALDRCANEGDWMREEILYASQLEKDIIPLEVDKCYHDDKMSTIPESVGKVVGAHQFSVLDTETLFRESIQKLIIRIRKGGKKVKKGPESGAIIHVVNDYPCWVYHFRREMLLAKTEEDNVLHLRKGRHLLEFKAVDYPQARETKKVEITDEDIEDMVEVSLKEKVEAIQKEAEAKRIEEEKRRESEARRVEEEKRREMERKEAEAKRIAEEKKREEERRIVEDKKKEYYAEQYKKWKQLLEQKKYDEALECLKSSAEGNHLEALDSLAYQFFKGSIYKHDTVLAEYYARRGAELGHDGCQLWLGQILRETNRKEEALRWLIKSAEQGQGWSQYLVGEMYEKGEGTSKDIEKAIYWYRMSAKNYRNALCEDAQAALRRLCKVIYEEGEYMRLVEKAHIRPHDSLKELYEYEGRLWDHEKSPQRFAALLSAAEQGYPFAQEKLGDILISRDAKEFGIYDEKKSKKWHSKAFVGYKEYIRNGDVHAMEKMGDIYRYGRCGKKKDVSLAEKYYRMGAELGHDGCQLWLGQILRETNRKEEALRWLIKSGEQGQGWSAYLAGEMYENGEGTPKDIKKAIEWYSKSAETYNLYAYYAKDALERLKLSHPKSFLLS